MRFQKYRPMRIVSLVLAAVIVVVCDEAGASGDERSAVNVPPTAAPRTDALGAAGASAVPAGHPAIGGPGADAGLTGTVVETMNASGYTYMRLKTAKGEIWAAVKESKVAQGSTVTVVNSMPMDGFESKTLNRKFDRIVFGALAGTPGPPAAPASLGAQHAQAASGPAITGRSRSRGPRGRTAGPWRRSSPSA